MLKMTSQVENIVNAYKQLAKIPAVAGARLNKSGNKISSKWSLRNLDRGKTTKFMYDYVLDDQLKVISESEFGIDVSNELLSSVSPSERLKAVVREQGDTKDTKKQFLEVWQSKNLAYSIDLAALDIHGDVYADSEFGSLDWSPDETSIVYIAEKKLEKSEPYIKRKPAKDASKSENGSGEKPIKKGEEYLYRQDWGEQLVGKHLSVVVVCKLESETFTVLEGLPESWCPGQVRWSPDGKSVVGVAWDTEPRRLGLIFCTNRPSFIFNLTLDGQCKIVSAKGLAVRSPRISPAGDRLVWLQRSAGGPHHACHQLVSSPWPLNDTTSVIVDIVATEKMTTNGKAFHGVYCQSLPGKCFTSNSKRLVFSTQQRTEVRSYVVDIESGTIVDISDTTASGSTSILDVKGDLLLASRSSITRPSQLIVARLPPSGSEHDISWSVVSAAEEVPAAVRTSQVHYLDLEHKDSQDSVRKFSAIYSAPEVASGNKLPLVVWPHGGPHSGFVNAFSLEAGLFAMLGFASIQVNYRGSVGDGQASVEFLLSRAGSADVLDCKLATDEALKLFAVNPKRLCLFGGSHGGFLVTHLSGQYPDTYAAVVSRNPVIDIATMINSTDIADWCAVEAGFEFTEKGPVSEEELLAMRRASPLAHVHRVKAPTALMLGSVDKRVPYYQGLEYYRRLKANGCVTRLYMYEDNHSLSTQAADMDNLINSAHWFIQHLQE